MNEEGIVNTAYLSMTQPYGSEDVQAAATARYVAIVALAR